MFRVSMHTLHMYYEDWSYHDPSVSNKPLWNPTGFRVHGDYFNEVTVALYLRLTLLSFDSQSSAPVS